MSISHLKNKLKLVNLVMKKGLEISFARSITPPNSPTILLTKAGSIDGAGTLQNVGNGATQRELWPIDVVKRGQAGNPLFFRLPCSTVHKQNPLFL
jgi:hypothetical protein